MILINALELSHAYASRAVRPGDTVVDATAGKGRDTVFLSELTGENGQVYAFDIQKEAVDATEKLLNEKGIRNVIIINDSHEAIDDHVKPGISCVMFNLGFLPGFDHIIQTKGDSTVAAIEKSMKLLAPGGIVTIAVYHGKDTGYDERDRVLEFCKDIDQERFTVMQASFPNQKNDPPIFICIEKH